MRKQRFTRREFLQASALAGVAAEVQKQGASIILDGHLINRVGLAASSPGDVSDPGLVVKIA